jgi:peroxiredoxin Q/BCP
MLQVEQELKRMIREAETRLPLLGGPSTPQLQAGGAAPLFAATTWTGEHIDLESCRGTKTWVAFFRHASCPMCLLRVNEMIQRYPAWAAPDFRIVGVFHSTPQRIAHNVGQLTPPFSLLSDPQLELYRQYGLRRAAAASFFRPATLSRWLKGYAAGYRNWRPDHDEPNDTVPGDFLIDADGTLRDVFYGRAMGEHIPFARVERWLGFTLPRPEDAAAGGEPERSYRELFGGE